MTEKPYSGKAKIRFDGRQLKIIIPSKKNVLTIFILVFWIAGMIFSYFMFSQDPDFFDSEMPKEFSFFWFFAWGIGGVFVAVILTWIILGRETVIFENNICQIKKGILDFAFVNKSYELKLIKNLELNPADIETNFLGQKRTGPEYGFKGGKIRFDYGMKTKKFGIGIDEAEARFIIDEIIRYGYFKDSEENI